MVFHDRYDDFVAFVQKSLTVGVSYEVEALGGATCKDYLSRRACVDELTHRFTCGLVQVSSLL